MARKHVKTIPVRYPKKMKDGSWAVVKFWLEERAAVSLEKMRNEFKRIYHRDFLITDAGRTHAQQVYLKKMKPRLAATPGKSWHEAGLAIDVDTGNMISACGTQGMAEAFMARFGWKRTVSYETWHYQYNQDYPCSRGVTGAIAYIGNDH